MKDSLLEKSRGLNGEGGPIPTLLVARLSISKGL